MSSGRRVSVVVPTFNRGPALRATLERLLASDLDEGDELEILVVDDGSSPAAEDVVARTGSLGGRWPLTWLRQDNAGPAAARNAGFRAARGDVVLFVDDDILVPPGLVRAHLTAHRARPGSVIFGLCPFVASARRTPFAQYLETVPDLRPGTPDEMVPMSTVASGQLSIERRQFEAEGRVYSPTLATPAAEEFELAHRLRARGIAILAAVGILAEHDQPVEVGAYCVQQYKHGLGCGEVAARQPEVMSLPALGRVIEASRPAAEGSPFALRERVKSLLARPGIRGALIRLARVQERLPLPARLRAVVYRTAISAHFVAGVRDGLARYAGATAVAGREKRRVRLARLFLRQWPFPRGRQAAWRVLRPFLPSPPFLAEIEPGILVAAGDEDFMLHYFFLLGFRRDPAFALVRSLVRPGDTVLDVGANVGMWVLGVARAAGPTAVVHAFEPLPANFERLAENLRRNALGWVRCHRVAVADRAGEARFLLPGPGNSGVGSLSAEGSGASVTVEVTTLDAFVREQGLSRVHILKVDVEGAELRVFRGATTLLGSARPPVIMFEVGETLAAAFGATTTEVKQFLVDAGYGLYRLHAGRLQGVTPTDTHPGSEDLLALQPSHLREHPALAALLEGPTSGTGRPPG